MAEVDVVGRGSTEAFRLEGVVAEWVVARAQPSELGFGEPGVGHQRVLVVVVAAQGDGLAVADLSDPLEVEVVDLVVQVVACAVALFARVVEQHAGTADVHLAVKVVAVADRALHVAAELAWCIGGDVVDHAADGLRAELQGIGTLEHLDPVEAVDRRVVVAGVVAIGRVADRDAVLKQRDLGRARRVEAADADVGPQAKALLVAHVDAGDAAQGLVGGEHLGVAQFFRGHGVGAAAQQRQVLLSADHVHARGRQARGRGLSHPRVSQRAACSEAGERAAEGVVQAGGGGAEVCCGTAHGTCLLDRFFGALFCK